MNSVYMEQKQEVRGLESDRDRNEALIMNWIDKWRWKRKQPKMLKALLKDCPDKVKERHWEEYCQKFYERGMKRTAYKHMKLFAQVAGNRMYERRMKVRVTTEVKNTVTEMQLQLEFLESMIKEMEEKYRIELRKKAILKNQCD